MHMHPQATEGQHTHTPHAAHGTDLVVVEQLEHGVRVHVQHLLRHVQVHEQRRLDDLLKLFHRQAKPFRNVVECLPQTVHATSGQIDETTASRIHRRTSQRLSHPFAVLTNQSLDGGNGTSSRLFAKSSRF
jgi:hypothetical protein